MLCGSRCILRRELTGRPLFNSGYLPADDDDDDYIKVYFSYHNLIGQVARSGTVEQGMLGSVSGSGKIPRIGSSLGFLRFWIG